MGGAFRVYLLNLYNLITFEIKLVQEGYIPSKKP